MPKSKRNKLVTLARTATSGKQGKSKLIDSIRAALEEYKNIYVFATHNVRTTPLKQVRSKWNSSRFFMGKNKVMQLALGKDKENELKDNLRLVSANITGNCGLLFTNEPESTVKQFFQNYKESDFARSGFEATQTIQLEAGPTQFDHSVEAYLRTKLGMPTSLKQGIVSLEKPYLVCTEGKPLTPEKARILKLLGITMSEFKIELICRWSTGEFEQIVERPTEDDGDVGEDDEDAIEEE